MFKPLFLGVGIFLLTIGIAGHLVVNYETRVVTHSAAQDWARPFAGKIIEPPPWRPWALMAAGAVLLCWSFTIPKKIVGDG